MKDANPGPRALLLVNAKSRSGADAAEDAETALREAGLQVTRGECGDGEKLREAIRAAASTVDMVVLGGGDGTMNAAAPALREAGLPLGILPLGTANDLARTLAIPLDIPGAVGVIAAGQARPVDLGEVNGQLFFNVASIGLSVAVARELSGAVKQRWGRLGYAIATARAVWRARPFAVELRCGGERRILRSLQVAVGNGRHYGGGMTVKQDAAIDDGRLDLYSIEARRLWKLALVYPLFRTGRHRLLADVRTASFTEAEIRTRRPMPVNTDGEVTTETPARFRVLRGALRVFAPEA
ncbi:lipid kinase [Sabulicella glaciei]|uniref:Lipid kinase n=1 Tax=Sabulicella glaciei TaxID=2984948 RepID=A0ABT3NSL0_9PROT|nr:lipid kinase [Roseococcus sp. MDT2-1-1]MCW8085141.1 lipid kinase [Roseococcus sp. MDT2-1-1]